MICELYNILFSFLLFDIKLIIFGIVRRPLWFEETLINIF